MTMPNKKKKKGITHLTVPQALQRLNEAGVRPCRMANGNAVAGATR